MKFPRIKICGVTRLDDLRFLQSVGVDCIGLNLVPSSRRYLELKKAVELAEFAKSNSMQVVAVVMNPQPLQLNDVIDVFSWDFIQLHGDEPPELARCCGKVPIIKAMAWTGVASQVELLDRWVSAFDNGRTTVGKAPNLTNTARSGGLAGWLIDAYAPGVGGGSGQLARWDLLQPQPTCFADYPVLLAGGLTPANVRQALEQTGCDGVDVASGVEDSPGIKNHDLVQQFVRQALEGFQQRSDVGTARAAKGPGES